MKRNYLGYSYLRSFIANFAGGRLTGVLVDRYVPETGARQPAVMWFTFAGVGIIALIALFAYNRFVAGSAGKEGAAG